MGIADQDLGIGELPELWTIREAAARFRVHRGTLYEWIKRGELRAVRIGGKMLVPASEYQRVIDEALA